MQETLREFGLTKNEVKIYLALLYLGTANPNDIAEKTGFSRSYVYDALERLIDKQIVSSVLKNNKKHYTATDPKRIEELAKQRLEKIQSIIPSLEKIQKSASEDINVELHKGEYVYKILLQDIISTQKKGSEVLIFGIDDEVMTNMDKHYMAHLKQYFAKLQKMRIKEKVIAKTGAKVLEEAKTSKYKFLSKNIIGNTAFEVYGNKVAIFLWGTPHHLIIIESKKVAESYRNQFKILWENSIK